MGNLCALVNDPQDMAPYVDLLMPDIKAALSDPLPEVGWRGSIFCFLSLLVLCFGSDGVNGI